MILQGKFQAKKLTKREKDGNVYRTLWIKDEDDNDLQVSITAELLGVLKKDGVYNGYFEFRQYQRLNAYGLQDSVKLVAVDELKEDLKIVGTWEV